jgi:hypothetical protein
MYQNNITPESFPPDLAQIVTAWPNLPKHIKTAIKALVNTFYHRMHDKINAFVKQLPDNLVK